MKNELKNIFLNLKIFLVISVLLLASITLIISAYEQKTSNQYNQFFLITKADFSGVDFEVSIGEFTTSSFEVNKEVYDKINIQNCGFTSDYGKAELPAISYYIAVPQGAEIVLNYEFSEPIILKNYNIYPAQPPKPETGGFVDPPFTKNESFYLMDEYYPDSIVEISSNVIMRGCRIIRLTLYPFSYNPVTNFLKKFENVKISIDFVESNNEFIPERLRSIYFQPIFDAFLINSQTLERAIPNSPSGPIRNEDRADLLIVVYDDFYEEILPLAEWRHQTGIETKVVKWSEIGTTSEDLRDYVEDAYYNWELVPSFLLIVGDADHVPVNYLYTHPYHYTPTGTDHWYVAFEGDDYLPEMHAGRISVEDEDELAIVVDKILDYSKTPYMDINWFDDILLAAMEESGRYFVYTSERLYNFLNPLGYNCNRQYQGTTPPGSTQGVIDAIDSGVIIANHRDHGAAENDDYPYTGWSGPQFDTKHIQNTISNGKMYPVMFALHCDSGWFDGETDSNSGNWESIGEVGIRVENKGFVAVIASTRVSYSGYNDEFCIGLYDAMWSDFYPNYPNDGSTNPYDTEVYRISQVMNYGKFWMYDIYIVPGGCDPYPWAPSESASRTEFEMFHVHGDPTMEVWTAFPEDLIVNHPDMVQYGPSTVEVQVEDSDGNPVEKAFVCLSQENGFYAKNLTDESGYVELDIEIEESDNVTLTVTSHNYLFYSAALMLGSSYPPDTPVINGSTVGRINKEYEYIAMTTDPEGDQILYMFDWGDGSTSDWIGPVYSGESVYASHSWSEIGSYNVRVRAKDIEEARSKWSNPYTVYMDVPDLKIGAVRGGLFYITATIKNDGVAEADNINWEISLEDGTIILGKANTGTITSIPAGGEETVRSNLIFGFGQIRVKVTGSGPECYANCDRGGKVFLIYIHVNPGGSA